MGKVLAVIPARYGSTRLSGKPLASVGDRPLIRRVYEGAEGTGLFDRVVVATDDVRILEAVREFGGAAVMTAPDHTSGTDRVAEVARDSDADIVVNVQGDLPFVGASLLEAPLAAMKGDPAMPMATVSVPIESRGRWRDPNVVKVVTDTRGFALYFSRAPIPGWPDPDGSPDAPLGQQHIGIYLYRRDFLFEFASWTPTRLERRERLEQLRVLERGRRIYVASAKESVIEVDTPRDLEAANRRVQMGEAS